MVGEVTFEGRAKVEADWRPRFQRLRVGMAIDEFVNVVGQPTRMVRTIDVQVTAAK